MEPGTAKRQPGAGSVRLPCLHSPPHAQHTLPQLLPRIPPRCSAHVGAGEEAGEEGRKTGTHPLARLARPGRTRPREMAYGDWLQWGWAPCRVLCVEAIGLSGLC